MSRREILDTYPLGEAQPERIRSYTGVPFDEITLDAVRAGRIGSADLTIDPDTLWIQAEIAEAAGYRQLAENLRRAAELTNIPNDRLLEFYEALRPRRSTYAELLALGDELERHYEAVETARFVREAAEAYRKSGLLREDEE